MKKEKRKWVKDEKRLIKLLYRTGIIDKYTSIDSLYWDYSGKFPRIIYTKNDYLDNINDKNIVIESRKLSGIDELRWDNMVRGAGAPPIKTKHGWLVFYHAMDKRDPDKYKVGAMILDYNDPTKILYRSKHPILEPIAHYENNGAKSGVVYVCGAVIKDDTLFVYYGGSDSVVCVATINVDEFLGDLTREIVNENINDSKKKRKRKKRINRKKSNNNKKKKIKNKN